MVLEGHRIFAFPGYADLATTIVYLAATDKLLFERGTEAGSIRKHKLFLSNALDQLQKLNKMIILEGEKSQVYLVCQALQIALLEDANLDASHLSADIELDGEVDILTFLMSICRPAFMVDSGSLFVLNSETISWYNFQVSQCAGHFRLPFVFFRAVTMQCITQEGTNLKAGQSCSPEKVCLQHFNRQFTRGSVGTPEGNSRISGNHGIQRRAPLLGSKTLKASKHFRNHWIH